MAGGLQGDKQQGGHAAGGLLADVVFTQGNDSESRIEAGFVHAPFFASVRIVNASQFS